MPTKKLRILLAEDSAGKSALALKSLYPEAEKKLDLITVSSLSTLLPALPTADPEMLLLDLSLVPSDPLDAVRRVHRAAPEVPLVVLADPADKQFAAQSLHEGAMDYMVKGDMDVNTLDRVLSAVMERNTLGGLADLLRDPLTGLYIRDGLHTLGARAMEAARHNAGTLVLLCALLENSLEIRDEFGTAAADHATREVADLLTSTFRRTDLVARLGESQFAALATDTAEPTASIIRQRLDDQLVAVNKARADSAPLKLRISVQFWRAKDARTFPEFLDSVEAGLRQSGRILPDQEAPALF
jgi:diguanylate cyclase (GGDEF)-like protein